MKLCFLYEWNMELRYIKLIKNNYKDMITLIFDVANESGVEEEMRNVGWPKMLQHSDIPIKITKVNKNISTPTLKEEFTRIKWISLWRQPILDEHLNTSSLFNSSFYVTTMLKMLMRDISVWREIFRSRQVGNIQTCDPYRKWIVNS